VSELETLNKYDQLWIRRSLDGRDKDNLNAPNSYEVTSRTGRPIYKVVQTLEPSSNERPGSSSKPFKLCVFDMQTGNEVLKIVAKQASDSAVVSTRQKHMDYHGIGKILRIRQGTRMKSPNYNVRGNSGKVVLKVNGSCCLFYKRTTFDICTSDNSHCYGKIYKEPEDEERRYRHVRGDETSGDDTVYKIKFPIDISMVSKALILATALCIDYDYFDCGTKEAKADFVLMSAGLIFVTFVLVLIVVVISVSVTTKLAYLAKGGGNHTLNDPNEEIEFIQTTTTTLRPRQRKVVALLGR